MDITQLLTFAVKHGASDLHLSAGSPPVIRVDGDLRRINLPELDRKSVSAMIHDVMSEAQRKDYAEHRECDFSFEIRGIGRFRVNAYIHHAGAAAAVRPIPATILTLDELNCPPVFKELAELDRGIVLVTGPTGSGKSTTLAAMIDYKSAREYGHIITLEDPIEFVYRCERSLINQREIHRDTKGFSEALRAALREDPDTILVGELRDPETIRLAITAAETGHLVLATLHTASAAKTIERIIDVFPADEKALVRSMLSESLQAVISQMLIKRIDGGRVAAYEILRTSHAVRNLIREGKVSQLYSAIQTGQRDGMCTFDQCLHHLLDKGIISTTEAKRRVRNERDF